MTQETKFGQWLSTSEQIPECDMYLNFVVGSKVYCGFYDSESERFIAANGWNGYGELTGDVYEIDVVVCWMPAPNPPWIAEGWIDPESYGGTA
ncbi:hypothetical protein KRX19_05700 [Cardiobacteriaceae bacterium TAE3-ERU3]|nr:hypothetical protein [Cardiobacteriaceae bacterium TAE3-ERU3]